jgi:hypothetical protein
MFSLFATGIKNTSDTGSKICHGVIDTGANLPTVLWILVVHLDLGMSPEFSQKFEMTLILFSGDCGS